MFNRPLSLRAIAACLALAVVVAAAGLRAADNYIAADEHTTGSNTAPVQFRSTDNNGVHTPHVMVEGLTVVGFAQPWNVQTAANGTSFTPLPNIPCAQVRVLNPTSGTMLEVLRAGQTVVIHVPYLASYTFRAVTNASQLSIRRTDNQTTPVSAEGEAEQ